MSSTLPNWGRFASVRALSIFFFSFLLSITAASAKTIIIGSGAGIVSVGNMTNLAPGDVLEIKSGTYSGGVFGGLKGIKITSDGGQVIFTGTVTLAALVDCEFSHVQFKNCPGIAIRWDGNHRRVNVNHVAFYNVGGSCNDAADQNQYNGDTTSLKMWNCKFDSLTLDHSGLLMQASWGNAQNNICFIDSFIVSHVYINQTGSNGTEMRGTYFRLDAHDWRVMYSGLNPVLGDVGMFYYTGDGYIHNIYRNGGRGYIVRVWDCGLNRVGKTYFYNNIDLNSATYGSIDTRTTPIERSKYTQNGDSYVFNNTSGNKGDNIGFWSPVAVIGQLEPGFHVQVRNNLGFSLTLRGKPPIATDQSNSTWPVDSSYNFYYASADGIVDPVTGTPVANSPVIGKGQAASWIKSDIYGHARTGAMDVGAVQHGGAPVAAPNNPPVATVATGSVTITLPVNSVHLDGSASSDPDGTIKSYSWTKVSGNGGGIASATASQTDISGLTEGTYVYQLTVTDNDGATGTTKVTVTVKPAVAVSTPAAPTANAGSNITITLPANTATIDGSASAAASGGTISTYAWKEVSGPSTAAVTNSAKVSLTSLVQGTYIFALTVTDSRGKTGLDSVTVTVKPNSNTPPVADAGNAVSITLPVNYATLDGSASSDPGGSISLFNWTLVSGPTTPTISGATTSKLSVSGMVAGDYVYQLKVTDYGALSSTDQVTIHVSPANNVGPKANAGGDQTITLPTNSVTLDGAGSTDPDGSVVGYSWSLISGPAGSRFSSQTDDQPKVTGLVEGVYVFELSVTDNSGTKGSDRVTVTVKPEAKAPNQAPVANAGYNLTISLPINSTDLNGSASFDPDGTIATYTWSQVSGPGTAGFNSMSDVSPKVTGLVAGTYVFQLSVTDNDGATSTDEVTVSVKASPAKPAKANTAPIADAGADGTITLPSSTYVLDGSGSSDPDGSIVTYQWSQVSGPATAAATFMTNATVTLTDLKAGTYVFQVKVTDNGGLTATSTMTLTVKSAVVSSTTDAFIIYPNPAHDVAHGRLTSSITGTVKTTLFDANGRIVWTDEVEKTGTVIEKAYPCNQLAPGVYSVQVNIANKKVMTSKFIKR